MLLLIKYFVTNCDCRHGPGKLQNLFENPPLEASPGQEDELKVIGNQLLVVFSICLDSNCGRSEQC